MRIMRAAYASRFDADNPLTALEVGERPEPEHPGPDWVTVRVRASSSTTTTCGRCVASGWPRTGCR
ncbi:hypothetical protein GCM10027605_62730 [Micromonospora zhanjiangensis]